MNARDVLLEEAMNHNNWKRTCKKKYDIWMCMPGPGKNVTNFLEGSHYVTNENKPFILSETLLANRPEVKHSMGDFLVCTDNNGLPNFNDMWVVNGAIFQNTYDMRAFPGLTGGQMKQGRQTTPRPNTRVL